MKEQNNPQQTTSGVEDLIRRVRDEGVGQAKEESRKLLDDARAEAARIVAEATAEAEEAKQEARAEIEDNNQAAMAALHMAARDTVLDLVARVSQGFENHVRRLVSTATMDEDLVRTIVLTFAGKAAQEITKDKELEIMVSRALFDKGSEADERLRDRAKEQILSISGEMLREGVELIAADDMHGGARVRIVGESLEIDLSDDAISELLLRFMQPRFVSILKGKE
jgi:V/A-type H+-transporting ATPase subunit E